MKVDLRQLLGFLLLVHASYSLLRYRRYLTFQDRLSDFHIPLDVVFSVLTNDSDPP